MTAASPRTRPASARSWSSCASAAAGRCPSCSARKMTCVPTIARAASSRHDRLCRRSAGLGRAARPLLTRSGSTTPIAYSTDGACTNQAESFFSRLRRAEMGQHHHISGKYLGAYAREMAWREDTRRKANGTLHGLVAASALGHPVSRIWAGYWQRKIF